MHLSQTKTNPKYLDITRVTLKYICIFSEMCVCEYFEDINIRIVLLNKEFITFKCVLFPTNLHTHTRVFKCEQSTF